MVRVAGDQPGPRLRPATHILPQRPLGQAFAEYGRIDKTLHLLGILDPIDDTYHRRLNKQPPCRSPATASPGRSGGGQIRQPYREGQEDQLAALGLVVNAVAHTGHEIGGMAMRLVQIAMNARDDSALGRFWAEALGWTISSEEPGVTNLEPEGFTYPDPIAVCIDIIAVPEPKTVKNRVHIDLATTAHQADLIARLQDLGATPADVGRGDVPWTVLADPEGNEFCVREPRSASRDTGPVAAVVADCADPRAMARFWGEAMDWNLHEVTDDHAVLRSAKGIGPYLEFLRTPDAKTVKNRVHLDLRPYPGDDQAAEVARLRALGATDIDLGQGDVPWTCLVDPEGNEFDVLTPR